MSKYQFWSKIQPAYSKVQEEVSEKKGFRYFNEIHFSAIIYYTRKSCNIHLLWNRMKANSYGLRTVRPCSAWNSYHHTQRHRSLNYVASTIDFYSCLLCYPNQCRCSYLYRDGPAYGIDQKHEVFHVEWSSASNKGYCCHRGWVSFVLQRFLSWQSNPFHAFERQPFCSQKMLLFCKTWRVKNVRNWHLTHWYDLITSS